MPPYVNIKTFLPALSTCGFMLPLSHVFHFSFSPLRIKSVAAWYIVTSTMGLRSDDVDRRRYHTRCSLTKELYPTQCCSLAYRRCGVRIDRACFFFHREAFFSLFSRLFRDHTG